MRILVLGPSSGGKSALTRKISEKFDLPRLEMDRLWFESGGHSCFLYGCTEAEKKKIKGQIDQSASEFLSHHENWVIDGTHTKPQPMIAEKAGTIVLIERLLLHRLISHIARVIKKEGRHPETSTWEDLKFSKSIFSRWLKGERKRLNDFLILYNDKLVVLRSFEDIDKFFESLKQ